ncbi:MAG: hypothetical protein AAGK04_12500, partial [Planctomycetota bacterium]
PSIERGRGFANEILPDNTSRMSDRVQIDYRYNFWEAIFIPPPPIGRDYVWKANRIGRASHPDVAVLTFDMAFADWKPEFMPHGEGNGAINVGYLDGHADSLSSDRFFELNPEADMRREGANPFFTRGWSTGP